MIVDDQHSPGSGLALNVSKAGINAFVFPLRGFNRIHNEKTLAACGRSHLAENVLERDEFAFAAVPAMRNEKAFPRRVMSAKPYEIEDDEVCVCKFLLEFV